MIAIKNYYHLKERPDNAGLATGTDKRMSTISNNDWLTLIQQNRTGLMHYLAGQVESREDITELLHELYLRVTSARIDRPIENPKSYLYRIAANLAIDLRRKRLSQARTLENYQYQLPQRSDQHTPERIVLGRERLRILEEAVKSLPPKCKEVFLLRKSQHLSPAEISDRLGISRNMVEKHLRKALAHCREQLEGKIN